MPEAALSQQARTDELANLFDRGNPNSNIALGGQNYAATIDSNRIGTTKVFDTSALSNTQLEAQARTYVNELTGGATLTSKGNPPQVWTAVLDDGSTVTLRSVSSSPIGATGNQARWTIRILNNPSIEALLPRAPKIEIKLQ